MIYLKAVGLWMLLGVVATACGILREKWLVPFSGKLRGHQIGTLVVCLLFAGIINGFVRAVLPGIDQALAIGLLWMVLTVLFEFAFGHWVLRRPWSLLLADYNLLRGRLWILVLLTEVSAPAIVVRTIGPR
jgi:hypothetical protein